MSIPLQDIAAEQAPHSSYKGTSPAPPQYHDREWLTRRVGELGEWFHNLDLNGVSTAPNHFLGDFPNIKWESIKKEIPEDLSGATVLDIGCNGGFYSIQMKRRGAERVLGIDIGDRYLNQARFAADTLPTLQEHLQLAQDTENKLKPIAAKEKADRIERVFATHFDKAMAEMPEFKEVVNRSVIKTLSLDPANANKNTSKAA